MSETENRWPLRPVVTAGVGAAGALIVERIGHHAAGAPLMPGAAALAMAVATAALLAIVTLERRRAAWSAVFAGGWGVVAGAIVWWSGPADGRGDWFWDWRSACLVLAIAVAAPLFQTARDAGRPRFADPRVHDHAWTNALLVAAGLAFMGLTLAMVALLSELFQLIGITLLRELLRREWAVALLMGAAFGGAVGLLRERGSVLGVLQRAGTAILSVLAPVLATGLLLFLAALPFTGLGALWDATRATTPILLSCLLGAVILVNAVIGDGEDAPPGRVLRFAAAALALATLPLAAIAAVATRLRIAQYGYTPERLWGVTFVAVACAVGIGYWLAVLRGRGAWMPRVRAANLRLAFAIAILALVLATPLVSFNTISARDQAARLASGSVSVAQFDWAAAAFDFGEPGRALLRRLAASPRADVARAARTALAQRNRYTASDIAGRTARTERLAGTARVLPAQVPLPPALLDALADWNVCGSALDRCLVLYTPGAAEAVAVTGGCVRDPVGDARETGCSVQRLRRDGGRWIAPAETAPTRNAAANAALRAAVARGAVSVRPVTRRQVFVGDVPVGDAFE